VQQITADLEENDLKFDMLNIPERVWFAKKNAKISEPLETFANSTNLHRRPKKRHAKIREIARVLLLCISRARATALPQLLVTMLDKWNLLRSLR